MKRLGKHVTALQILIVFALCAFHNALAAQEGVKVPVEVLQPVTNAQGRIIQATAPDGKAYPVFRVPQDSPLIQHVRDVMQNSFAQQALKLDRYARNLLLHEPGRGAEQRLTEPMYLLLSGEEGGFARYGFWLEDQSGAKRLVLAGYVDLVVDEEDIASRNLEEIFSHELGHEHADAEGERLQPPIARKIEIRDSAPPGSIFFFCEFRISSFEFPLRRPGVLYAAAHYRLPTAPHK
jgi:hypothetical protein